MQQFEMISLEKIIDQNLNVASDFDLRTVYEAQFVQRQMRHKQPARFSDPGCTLSVDPAGSVPNNGLFSLPPF